MSAAAADEVPQQLGEFVIDGELGRGGSGVVYAARWDGREIALKVLRPDEASTPKERDRFLGEARLLAKVQHPGVVRVHASGVLPDGRPYLAMERLHGAALAERLLMGRMPVGQALGLFEQVAAAVSALHAAGIVHRDIKPENIMLVDPTGASPPPHRQSRQGPTPSDLASSIDHGQRAVLLDFGIARGVDDAASTTTQMGLQRGTPAYMAPERFFGARATIGSDVYETAVVLFVMLTGHLPWRDPRSPHDRLEPRSPAALGVELPAGLEQTLMRALAPKPEGRPASIDELAMAIRRHAWEGDTVRGHAPMTHPGAAPISATTTRVRRPLMIGGALLALAGAAAVVVVLALGGGGGASRVAAGGAPLDAASEVPADAAVVVVQPLAPDAANVPADAAPSEASPADTSPADSRRTTRATEPGGTRGGKVRASATGPGPGSSTAPPPNPGSGPGTAAGSGPPPSLASYDPDMPTCAKLYGLYCTDEFKATEGTMSGKLCTSMQGVLSQFRALPEEARRDQEKFCKDNYATMSGAVTERLRQWRLGLGPGQQGVPPVQPDAGP